LDLSTDPLISWAQAKVNAQFDELGLKPEDVISKVMSDPELATGFSNPKVQAAIMDISQNPMNIVKYQQDPEVRSSSMLWLLRIDKCHAVLTRVFRFNCAILCV
jgi:hypothetical protein